MVTVEGTLFGTAASTFTQKVFSLQQFTRLEHTIILPRLVSKYSSRRLSVRKFQDNEIWFWTDFNGLPLEIQRVSL